MKVLSLSSCSTIHTLKVGWKTPASENLLMKRTQERRERESELRKSSQKVFVCSLILDFSSFSLSLSLLLSVFGKFHFHYSSFFAPLQLRSLCTIHRHHLTSPTLSPSPPGNATIATQLLNKEKFATG